MWSSNVQIYKDHEMAGLPLSGRTFLLTRSSEGNSVERKRLERYGADIIELPSIEIMAPRSWKKLDEALVRLDKFDWVVFTSVNGVKFFFDRLGQKYPRMLAKLRKLRATRGPKFACVGPATRKSLEGLGFRCFVQPKKFLTTDLAKKITNSMDVNGKLILLARAQVASREITRMLRDSGAKVIDAPTYRTVTRAKKMPQGMMRKITDLTLTSPSTVRGVIISIGAKAINSQGILVHCIGPVTAKSAKASDLKIKTVSSVHTIDGLVRAIIKGSK
ncbi:MAG: uroporphyrinogen-III synthase [Nitrososphaerota archaeon]|jgi:uroporphyrinogen-III synthase|nr:uroporphyrinogen-III synthase [Nitrososphaerota archaeon]